MHWFHYVAKLFLRVSLFLFTSWRVNGRENVPGNGPLLVVSNHLNFADPPIVSVSLGRQAIFMAKEELFRSWFSRFVVRNFGAFPVRRGGLDREAIRQAQQCLDRGFALVLFPEGTRSPTARLQPGLSGSALIAVHAGGVPILPVGVTGTEQLRGAWWLKRPRITINIGQTFSLPKVEGRLTKTQLTELTRIIMGHIAGVLPPPYQPGERNTP